MTMTEYEKMRSGEFYNFTDEELQEGYLRAKRLCARLQTMTIADDDYRDVIEALIPDIPQSSAPEAWWSRIFHRIPWLSAIPVK